MTNSLRALPRALPAALALAALGALPAAAGAAPVATAAKTCKAPKYPGSGYFTSLKVFGVSCATGRKVALAHYRCRTRHGIRGRCARVLGYRCSERRAAIATEFNSRTTCKSGSRKVVFTYQQFT